MKKYYEAYDERYKTIHKKGYSWAEDVKTPVVLDIIEKYGVGKTQKILEIGCGEGRDARAVLKNGYRLSATDVSSEAVSYCRALTPEYADCFFVLDCLSGKLSEKYDFIYSVAVVHMLTKDCDRDAFYRFIYEHLNENGTALICSMGDGELKIRTDKDEAFSLRRREHRSGTLEVAATTCRTVTFSEFESEITKNGLKITEKGLTSSPPEFDSLMYAVVKK